MVATNGIHREGRQTGEVHRAWNAVVVDGEAVVDLEAWARNYVRLVVEHHGLAPDTELVEDDHDIQRATA